MKYYLVRTMQDIFVISFITYIVYFAIEILFEGIISNYFDLNLLLILIIITGAALVFLRNKDGAPA